MVHKRGRDLWGTAGTRKGKKLAERCHRTKLKKEKSRTDVKKVLSIKQGKKEKRGGRIEACPLTSFKTTLGDR